MERRAYTLKELGQAYFPNIEPKSASKRLREWINEDSQLFETLTACGYTPTQRLLPWVCVLKILDRFGNVLEE